MNFLAATLHIQQNSLLMFRKEFTRTNLTLYFKIQKALSIALKNSKFIRSFSLII